MISQNRLFTFRRPNLLLSHLLKQIKTCLKTWYHSMGIGLYQQQLGIMTRGTSCVIRLWHRKTFYHLWKVFLLYVNWLKNIMNRSKCIHGWQWQWSRPCIGNIGWPVRFRKPVTVHVNAVSQPVHPHLSLFGTTCPHFVVFSWYEVDQKCVFILLARTDDRTRHALASSTLSTSILQQIIFQHSCSEMTMGPRRNIELIYSSVHRNCIIFWWSIVMNGMHKINLYKK